MRNFLLIILVTVISSIGITSCSDDKEVGENTARVQLKLVDSPGDYLEVNIEILDIQYQGVDGWTSFTPSGGFPINVDLTELIAGNSLLLTDEIVPSGVLNQIRLILSDNNNLVIEGEKEGESISTHLNTPSAQQSGLKLKLQTELKPGFSYTFILDWDVHKSIVKAGNSGKYNLKPVIRVNAVVNSGSIEGNVVGKVEDDGIDAAVPLKYAKVYVYTSDDIEITSTFTDDNGDFLILGLEAGDYKIKIEHLKYIDYESTELINVNVGEIFNVGTVELEVPVN